LPLGVAGQPRETVDVTGGRTSTLEVSLPPWGAAEFRVVDTNGVPFRGAVEFVLARADGRASDSTWEVGLTRPPYILKGLREGRYRVRARDGSAMTDEVEIAITRATVTQVALRLDRK
jgi:hypothetical protein